ncbi:hypothetical protein [Actinomyces vulturis]|uniref:hypothetical protein n=1 Tax=Actinomyces vulturis TaxID=1857645 RepID=UPI00159ECE46|nr:hypothetical protein [Actinomyces vulturis]
MMMLSAHNTPATPWAGVYPSHGEHMMFWDSGWYERIAVDGYPALLPRTETGAVAPNPWAFLPLFPLLVRVLMVAGLPFSWAGFTIALLGSCGTWIVLQQIMQRAGFSRTTSLWALSCGWLLPWGVILQVPYAESLGLFFLGLALVALQRKQWLVAIIPIVMTGLTRPLAVPLALTVTLVAGMSWRSDHHNRQSIVTMLASWCGAGLWPVIAALRTGQFDAYTATETAWRGGHLVPFAAWVTRAGEFVGAWLAPFLIVSVTIGILGLITALIPTSSRNTLVTTLTSWSSRNDFTALSRNKFTASSHANFVTTLTDHPEVTVIWVWCASYAVYLLVVFDPTTSLIRLLLPLAPMLWPLMATLRTPGRVVVLSFSFAAQLWWLAWIWNFGSVSIQWIP